MKEEWKDIYFIDKGITYDYTEEYQVSNCRKSKKFKIWRGKNIKSNKE